MDILFKQFFPIIMLLALLFFRVKHKKNDLLVMLIFMGMYAFSSNFQFVYRQIYQLLLIIATIRIISIFFKNNFITINKNMRPMIYFYLFILLSGVVNKIENYNLYINSIINYTMIFFTILFIYKKVNTLEKINELFNFIVLMSIILSIGVIIEFSFLHSRIEGLFSNSNYLALFLSFGYIILLFKKRSFKPIWLLIIGLSILFTGSRIVEISIFILSFYSIFLQKNTIKKIVTVIFLIPFFTIFFTLQQDFRKETKGSDLERLAILETSKLIIKDKLLTGVGYAQFQVKFNQYIPSSELGEIIGKRKEIVTHNDYLRIIDELGILVFLYFIYIIYNNFRIKKTNLYQYISFAFFVNMILFSFAHNNMNAIIFWFALLLPLYTKKISSNKYA